LASEAEIAAAYIDIQLEASRLNNSHVAGENVDFTALDGFVQVAKEIARPAPEPVTPTNPEPSPA
jgi:hypothetical protein